MHEGRAPIWLQVDSVPVLGRDGELKQVVTSFIDITQSRQAEDARRENEAKSRFLATMSHELRTPLNSVLGFAQLLADSSIGPLNERQLRYLGHIEASGRHLLSLINDVLDLSKVVAGQMKVDMIQLDARAVVAETVAELKPLAEGKALDVELAIEAPVQVLADSRRLHQVALNLLSNAIKFTPPLGRIVVTAECDTRQVRVSVHDTGPGIAAEEQERIFEEFTQVDSGPARHQEGTGLGLALSRRLMGLMGGGLSLRSEPGEGSTFTMTMQAAALGHGASAAEVVAQKEVGTGALHR
jgi:signal transduction histidine kinase